MNQQYSHTRVPALCAAVRRARRRLCRRLAQAVGGTDESLALAFPQLVFPDLREHRHDNATILGALHHVMPSVESGRASLGREVAAALRSVLDFHRLTADLVIVRGKTSRASFSRRHHCRAWRQVSQRRPCPNCRT